MGGGEEVCWNGVGTTLRESWTIVGMVVAPCRIIFFGSLLAQFCCSDLPVLNCKIACIQTSGYFVPLLAKC